MESKKPKSKDVFFGIKYIAYAWSQLTKSPNIDELVRFAQLELCRKTSTLMKDPIWDSYTQEEILVEFFALRFSQPNSQELKDFMIAIGEAPLDTFADWAEREERKSAEERAKKLEELPDTIKFSPKDLKG